MTTIVVRVTRTQNWLRAQRLTTGENVPNCVDVNVRPADLTPQARAIILTENGYTDVSCIGYRRDFSLANGYVGYGREDIIVDSLLPNPGEISDAIIGAAERVDAKRIKDEAQRAVRDAEEKRRKAEAAELEARKADARQLLADEFAAKDREIAKLNALIEDLREDLSQTV